MQSKITSNSIALKLKAIDPHKAEMILAKVRNENIEASACQWACNGHNLPKHNKLR
ncbi:MAG: hypothetical protein IPQ02_15140 [Saprospiraceae bacterium]|nr:hypothetical protein [Candidatus Defluviibacterium haderslevense]